jgi:hypothetical protein
MDQLDGLTALTAATNGVRLIGTWQQPSAKITITRFGLLLMAAPSWAMLAPETVPSNVTTTTSFVSESIGKVAEPESKPRPSTGVRPAAVIWAEKAVQALLTIGVPVEDKAVVSVVERNSIFPDVWAWADEGAANTAVSVSNNAAGKRCGLRVTLRKTESAAFAWCQNDREQLDDCMSTP